MLEIKPLQEKSLQEKICTACGIAYDADTLAYGAYENGVLLGAAQFGIHEEYGYLQDIRNVCGMEDKEALFIMGRAILNFIDLRGIHAVYFKPNTEEYEAIAKWIGFRKNTENRWYFNTENFFQSPCQQEK